MRHLFIILTVLFWENGNAQTYVPFPLSNVQWNCNYSAYWYNSSNDHGYESDHSTFYVMGDSLINGMLYSSLYINNYHTTFWVHPSGQYQNTWYSGGYFGGYRNDSLNKRVYIYPAYDTTEYVMYDFNINVGDTVFNFYDTVPDFYCITPNCSDFPIIVDSIDSVLIDGSYYKRFNLTPTGAGPIALIEGIGSTSGFMNPLSYFECTGALECYSLNNRTIFPDTGIACIILKVENGEDQNTFLYPNPNNGRFHLNSSSLIDKLVIYDINGREILNKSFFDNNLEIDISTQPPGIYVATLFLKNGSSQKVKIILN